MLLKLVYCVVFISVVRQSDPVIHVYTVFFIFFSMMIYEDSEYRSLCYTVGPPCLSIL